MPKKPYSPPTLAPIASADPRARATKVEALEELQARYEAAKQFMIEAELSAATLRKALRAAVLELRRGDGANFTEIADRLESTLHAMHTPSDAELAREDELKAQQAGEGVGK